MRFDELKQAMAAFDTLEVGRGASELDIRTAENALNLRILGDYRAFLRDYGWGASDIWSFMGSAKTFLIISIW